MSDKSSGQTFPKLGQSEKTPFLVRVFLAKAGGFFCFVLFFYVPPPPHFNKINIATPLHPPLQHVALSYELSPANEIMNSRLDTKADEGIFEHSKRERGEKEAENIPKINFHLQGSCIFNRERLNIIG